MTKRAQIIFLLTSIFMLIYNCFVPLLPDEAYYWDWGRHLALSYFDGPPLIAYSIRFLTLLAGDTVYAIKLVSFIYLTLTVFVIHQFTKRLWGLKVAEIALVLALFLPFIQIMYHGTTPDSPLFFFWMTTIYSFYLALETNKTKYFYLTGLSAGLLLLSKYNGILLIGALFLYLLFSAHRQQFKNPHLYFAALISFLIFSPVIIWNWQHAWVGFLFQWGHGVSTAKIFHIEYFMNFIGGQLGILNPVFSIGLIVLLIKHKTEIRNNAKLYFLIWPFAIPLLFFAYHACFKFSDANWPVASYLTAIIILAYWIHTYHYKKLYISGIVLILVGLTIFRFPGILPFLTGEKCNLFERMLGYAEMIQQAKPEYEAYPDAVIISNHYDYAAEAAFYLPDQPNVFVLNSGRYLQYSLWSEKLKEKKIKQALYIGSPKGLSPSTVYFKQCVKLKDLIYHGPYKIEKSIVLYRCEN